MSLVHGHLHPPPFCGLLRLCVPSSKASSQFSSAPVHPRGWIGCHAFHPFPGTHVCVCVCDGTPGLSLLYESMLSKPIRPTLVSKNRPSGTAMEATHVACAPCAGLNSCLAACRKRPMMAVLGDEASAWLVRLESGGEAASTPRQVSWTVKDTATCAKWSPDDRFLVLVTRRNLMAMQWDRGEIRWMQPMPLHFHARDVDVSCAADGPTPTYLVAVSGADGVQLFLLKRGEQGEFEWEMDVSLHGGYLMCKNSFSKDGKLIAVACVDGHVAIWKVVCIHPKLKMELVFLTVIQFDRITSLEFSDKGDMLAIGCWEGQLVLLKKTESGKEGAHKSIWELLDSSKDLSSQSSLPAGPTLLAWSHSSSMLAVSDGRSTIHFFMVRKEEGFCFLSQERIPNGQPYKPGVTKEGRTGMAKRVVDRKCVVSMKGFVRGPGLGHRLYCYGHSRNICSLLWPRPPQSALPAILLRFGCGAIGLDHRGKTVSIACGWQKRHACRPPVSIRDLKAKSVSLAMIPSKELSTRDCLGSKEQSSMDTIEEMYAWTLDEHDFLLTSRALLVKQGLSVYLKWREGAPNSWQRILSAGQFEFVAESGGVVCTTDTKQGIRFWGRGAKGCIEQVHPDASYAVKGCQGDDQLKHTQHSDAPTKLETSGLFAILVEKNGGYQLLLHMVGEGKRRHDAVAVPIVYPKKSFSQIHLIDFFNGLVTMGLVRACGRMTWLVIADLCSGLCQEFPVRDRNMAMSCLSYLQNLSLFRKGSESSEQVS
eukprot:scaffold285_cov330-Pavlova_lutheri.AAC.110